MRRRLTDKHRDVLRTIETVREATARRLRADYPGCNPTSWVNCEHLRSAFGITRRAIDALVRMGELEIRPSGGWGPEVRLATKRVETPTTGGDR